ncbi:MAG: signal peptidase I [Defluviitaleaceae bacterium]|nr:signal peptidase I [Defluviitaleaceae bacterium]
MMKLPVSRKKLVEYAKSFVYAFIVFIILYVFLWPVRIVGISMEPALNHNDRVFVSRALSVIGAYERGDMVMVRANYNESGRYIIKRIAALPGDEVKIENGRVLILADSQYFLMGDNREYSTDSRSFGPVNRRDIAAKVLFRFFSGGI